MPFHADSLVDLALLRALEPVDASTVPVDQEVLILFDRYGPALQRYVASLGLTADESEDITQDVFLALFRHLCLGRPRTNLRGWLFQVGHNLALKHRGRARRQHTWTQWNQESAPEPIDPAPDPEAQLAARERRQRLTWVVRSLPERDRRCLALRAEGLPYRDIAVVLGVSLGTVAKLLTRAMARLARADER